MKKKEIEPSKDGKSESQCQSSNSMVDIVVRTKQNDFFANLKVSSFDLILSLEFLMKIAQFVTVPQDGKPVAAAPTTITTSAVAKREPLQYQIYKRAIIQANFCAIFHFF